MPDQVELIDTLRETSVLLAAARKSIAANGHAQALLPIDKLIAMAQRDTDRRLTLLLSHRFGPGPSHVNALKGELSPQRH